MATTPQPILFYNPVWTVNDLIGQPNAGGFIYFYDSTDPTQKKTVYKDSTLTDPWPNPIEFDITGAQDDNYLIYGTDDGPYRVEITDEDGTPIKVFDPFPSAESGQPIVPDQEIGNQIANGQLKYFTTQEYSPVPVSITNVAPNFDFSKTNTSATDTLSFEQFILGQTEVASFPEWYINYECTAPGSSETTKDLIVYLSDVFAYSDTELTATISAISPTTDDIEILFIQNFGTGGSPSPQTVTTIATQALTSQWAQYTFTFTPPDVSGETLGTNNDGYTAIVYRYPLNVACNIGMTNFGLYIGNQAPVYQYQPQIEARKDAIAVEYPILQSMSSDGYNPADGNYDVKLVNGQIKFMPCAGRVVGWGSNTAPVDALLCDGKVYYAYQYYNLGQALYGLTINGSAMTAGPAGFIAIVTAATTAVSCVTSGVVTPGSAGTTPFTYTQTNAGSVGVAAQATVLCTAGSTIDPQMYFLINTPSASYYVWFSLNNTSVDPGPTTPALAGLKSVKVVYTGAETADTIANLVTISLSIAQFRVPDLRGLFERMPTFGATAVLPTAGTVTITSAGNDSGVSFAIVGLDTSGASISENLAGANSGVATSVNTYSAITSITPNNNTASTVTVGFTGDADGLALSQSGTAATALILNGQYSRDPDYATRYEMYTGWNPEAAGYVGSQQKNQNLSHNHTVPLGGNGGPGAAAPPFSEINADPVQSTFSGGNQSNPNNVNLNKIIYY